MADVFTALADPNRRHLLEALCDGERAVNELVDQLDIAQSGVSRHLRILREAGLVSVRRDAQRRLYSVEPEPLRELDAWLEDYRQLWEESFEKLDAHLERRQEKI